VSRASRASTDIDRASTDIDTDAQAEVVPANETPAARRSRLQARAERQAKREELRRQQKAANWRRQWLPWIIVAVLAVLAFVAFLAFYIMPKAQIIDGVERYGNLSQDHVAGPQQYPQTPPVGGPHASTWWNCGAYDQPIPKEMAVHSLEHGAVWITYQPDLPADAVQRLRSLARGRDYVLVSPWGGDPPLSNAVAATAWGYQLKVDSATDSRLDAFVNKYANGPQTPEKGALCRGGQGTPISNP
jgi:hypothetical protein